MKRFRFRFLASGIRVCLVGNAGLLVSEVIYVKKGQKVQAGDTLGIIEAMKIMNPLEATQSGVIAEILVDNSEVVQFGQPVIRYKA